MRFYFDRYGRARSDGFYVIEQSDIVKIQNLSRLAEDNSYVILIDDNFLSDYFIAQYSSKYKEVTLKWIDKEKLKGVKL